MTYTALIQVHSIEEPKTEPTRRVHYGDETVTTSTRPDPVEVAKVVVRADSLESLKEKVAAHVALI